MKKSNGIVEKLKRAFSSRHFYLILLVVFILSAVVVRLYKLQIVEGETHEQESTEITLVPLEIDTPRGDIYDRNGVLIATTKTLYEVDMTFVSMTQSDRNEMYLELVNLLDECGEDHLNSIGKYLSSPTEWSSSLKDDTEKQKEWINDFAIKKSDRDNISSPEDAFNYLKEKVFELDEDYSDEDAYKIMEIRYETYKYGLSSTTPLVIAEGVSEETMAILEARNIDFQGVTTQVVYKRQYVNAEYVGNIIGYVRAISNEEYEEMKDLGYTYDDVIGKTGIEKAEESYLKGEKGTRYIYYDKSTQTVQEYSREEAVPGNDVYLTIDLKLQEVAYNALEKAIKDIASQKGEDETNFGDANAGAVVVENVKTGEILAMASYPTYDVSLFLEPSSNQEAQNAITELFSSQDAPTLNRATQGLYAIGSTFKPVVASAALETGAITLETKYLCEGSVIIANRIHNCLGKHGELDVVTAIRQSCNIFFQRAALEVGIDTLDSWAKEYGLGEKTGIEISEYAGNRSNPETMEAKESDESHIWSDSDTAQTAIGQLYTLFTPIQVANYTSALANGGYVNSPYLVGKIVSKTGEVQLETENTQRKIDISQETLDIIKEGMIEMIRYSDTCHTELVAFEDGFVAGKTGTPETGLEAYGQSSNALFICYAPTDDPEIAISVVIEHGVWGTNAISVAARILESYFSEEINGNSEYSRNQGLSMSGEFRDIKTMWAEKNAEKK